MRFHLFEIEDFKWYPSFLRELQTDYLRKLMDIFHVYRVVIPRLQSLIDSSENPQIIDFCSGGGGSWLKIIPELNINDLRIVLTDLFPNITTFNELQKRNPDVFSFISTPVNALDPGSELKGIRTYFNSFHHFRETEAKRILKNAVDHGEPVAIFEPMEKSLLQFILNTVSTLPLAFFITPFIRPFRWDRLFFTYLIPIVPLVTTWDGWVSILRLHTPKDLLRIASEAGAGYDWEAGKASHTFGKVIFLIGKQKKRADQKSALS